MSQVGLFEKTALPVLRRIMDLSAWRQRTYAMNLANANTPGYTRQDVAFADELQRATADSQQLAGTNAAHMNVSRPGGPGLEVYEDASEGDGRVNVETEMVSLAENQLRFDLAARLAALRIQSLRASIRGGR